MNQSLTQQIIKNLNAALKNNLNVAFAYDRISDEIQSTGISLEYQEAGATKYANDNGLFIVHYFTIIESASKEGRKVFNQMIDLALKFGIKNLIFKNTDRMSRNYNDLVRIEKLIDEHDFNIHFYQSSMVINKKSSYNDRFLIGIQLAVAKHTSDKISQDVREHNIYKANRGIAPYQSPLGYVYDKENRKHVIDRERGKMCRYIFDEFDNNDFSLDRFAETLNKKGYTTANGKKWRKSQLHYMLTNPFYHGEFYYNGEIWPGTHEPYYIKERFHRRLKKLGSNFFGSKKRLHDFKLSGLLRCSCGRLMTGDIKKGKYTYYKHVCPNSEKQVYLKETDIISYLDREFARVRFSENFTSNLKTLFMNYADKKGGEVQGEMDILHRKISGLEGKKDKLLELFIDDEIDNRLLKQKLNDISKEIEELRNHEKSLSVTHDSLILKISEVIDDLRDKPLVYLNVPENEKVEIFKSMAKSVVIDGESAEIQWKKPYSFLMKPAFLSFKHELETKKDEPKSSNSSYPAHAIGRTANNCIN